MSTSSEGLSGPRLEFVVKKLNGTVKVMKHRPPPTKAQRDKNPELSSESANTQMLVEEDAGYMIFFPSGNCSRLSEAQFLKKGFEREPNIIGYEQANDNKSAVGRFKLARNETAKAKAWKEMEKEVTDACVGKFGTIDALLSNFTKSAKMKEAA